MRNRRIGSMRTLAVRRCALALPSNRHAERDLRLRRRVARGTLGARAGLGATPQSESLVRARGQVRLRTLSPPPLGSLLTSNPVREGHWRTETEHVTGPVGPPCGPHHQCRRLNPRSALRWIALLPSM